MRNSLARSFKERTKKLSGYYFRQSVVKYARQEDLTNDEMKRLTDWIDQADTRKELFASLNQLIAAIKELETVTKGKVQLKDAPESLAANRPSGSKGWVNVQAKRVISEKIKNITAQLILIEIISRTIELIIKATMLFIFLFLLLEVIRNFGFPDYSNNVQLSVPFLHLV